MRRKFRVLVVVVMVVALALTGVSTVSAVDTNGIAKYKIGQVEMIVIAVVGHDGYDVFLNLNGYMPKQITTKISGDFTEDELRHTLGQANKPIADAPPLIVASFYGKAAPNSADLYSYGGVISGGARDYIQNVYHERNLTSSVYNFIQPGNQPVNGVYIHGIAALTEILKDGKIERRKTTYSIYMDGQLMLDVTIVPKGAGRGVGSHKVHPANFQTGQSQSSAIAQPTASNIYVDGKEVSLGAYLIDNSNFVKLRDIAYILKDTSASFSVQWQQSENQINLRRSEPYMPDGAELQPLVSSSRDVPASNSQILCEFIDESYIHPEGNLAVGAYYDVRENGSDSWGNPKYAYVRQELFQPQAYNIDGSNYYKLRDVGHIAGFNVAWDEATKSVRITTSKQ